MRPHPNKLLVILFFVLFVLVVGQLAYLFYSPIKETFFPKTSFVSEQKDAENESNVTSEQSQDYSGVPYRIYNNGWVEYIRLQDHEALKGATLSARYEGVIDHIDYVPTEIEDSINGGSFRVDRSFVLGSEIDGDETYFMIGSLEGELFVDVYESELGDQNVISFDELKAGDTVVVYEDLDLTLPLQRSRTRFDIIKIDSR